MKDKKRDCTYCGGRGFVISNLIDTAPCQYCKGTGELDVKEKRKSILVSVPTHKMMRDMAYERKMPCTEYITMLIRADEKDYSEEIGKG